MKKVHKHAGTKMLPDAKNLQNFQQSGTSRISMFKNAVVPGQMSELSIGSAGQVLANEELKATI